MQIHLILRIGGLEAAVIFSISRGGERSKGGGQVRKKFQESGYYDFKWEGV